MVLFVRDINAGRPFLQLTDEADETAFTGPLGGVPRRLAGQFLLQTNEVLNL
jgi:hypothetical protein